MHNPSWSEDHVRLIADVAPSVPEPDELELARTWAKVRAELPVAPVRTRRRVRIAIGAGITAATLAVGGVAVAEVYRAHTGTYPSDAEDLRLGGPGEHLDPGAGDFGNVVAEVTDDIPFPTDQARQLVIASLAADGQREEPGTARVSTGAVRAWAAQGAVCAWANQWAGAIASGDETTRAGAARELQKAPQWPAVTDIDPVQKHSSEKLTAKDEETGEIITGTADNSTQFAFLIDVRKAAEGTDVGRMDDALDEVWCYGAPTENLPLTHDLQR